MDNYTITIPKELVDNFVNLYDVKYGGNENHFLTPIHEYMKNAIFLMNNARDEPATLVQSSQGYVVITDSTIEINYQPADSAFPFDRVDTSIFDKKPPKIGKISIDKIKDQGFIDFKPLEEIRRKAEEEHASKGYPEFRTVKAFEGGSNE